MEQLYKLIDLFETKNKLKNILDEPLIKYELKDNILYIYEKATFNSTPTETTVPYTLCIAAENFQTAEDMETYDLFEKAFPHLMQLLLSAEPTIATKLTGCLVNYQNSNELTIEFDVEDKHVLFVANRDGFGNGYKILYMNVEQSGYANILRYEDIPENILKHERVLYYTEQLK